MQRAEVVPFEDAVLALGFGVQARGIDGGEVERERVRAEREKPGEEACQVLEVSRGVELVC